MIIIIKNVLKKYFVVYKWKPIIVIKIKLYIYYNILKYI